MSDLFGVAGNELLDTVPLGDAYVVRVESLRDLLEIYDRELAMLDRKIAARLEGDKGYQPSRRSPGSAPFSLPCSWPRSARCHVSPTLAASRRGRTSHLAVESPTPRCGAATSPRWVRPSFAGAAIEAVARGRGPSILRQHWRSVAERRGHKIGRVAAARKLLTLVYCSLRDGEIRCLQAETA